MSATDSFILRKNSYEMLVVVDFMALVEIKSAMSVSLFYSSLFNVKLLKMHSTRKSVWDNVYEVCGCENSR